MRSRGTVVGIATIEGSGFESRCDQEFSLLQIVQTGSGVHPTSYLMGSIHPPPIRLHGVVLNSLSTGTTLHGVMSQMIEFFIAAAVRTSNPTAVVYYEIFFRPEAHDSFSPLCSPPLLGGRGQDAEFRQ
jgi:hypothetical protein